MNAKTPLKDTGNQSEPSKKSVEGANFQAPEPTKHDAPKPTEPERTGATDEEIAATRRSNRSALDATVAAMERSTKKVGDNLQAQLEARREQLGKEFDAYMDQLEEELSDKVDAGEIDDEKKREIIAFAQANDPRRSPLPDVAEPPPGTVRVRHISELDPSYNGKPDSIVVSSGNTRKTASR